MEKLNTKQHTEIRSNEIFIYSEIFVYLEMEDKFFKKFENILQKYELKFSIIYLMLVNYIYVFNFENKTKKVYKLEESIQYQLANEAREMVINAEKDEGKFKNKKK